MYSLWGRCNLASKYAWVLSSCSFTAATLDIGLRLTTAGMLLIVGTPRQGSLAPSTRAKITFHRSVSPDTLVGLEEFSHVWILFVFHQNTNGKNARAHEGLRSDSHRHTFRVRVTEDTCYYLNSGGLICSFDRPKYLHQC